MRMLIIASEEQYQELLTTGLAPGAEAIHVTDVSDLGDHRPEAVLDLLFEAGPQRALALKGAGVPVLVNSVVQTGAELGGDFVRINGWPGFLAGPVVEAAAPEALRDIAGQALAALNKKPEWLPDTPGFITPRVIARIINEALIAHAEGVSSKEDIDTAMKLGTNYPHGPFEWEARIGADRVDALLARLHS